MMTGSSKCDPRTTVLLIQSAKPTDLNALHEIRRKAWVIAYKDIYTLDEINKNFNGSSSERRTWPSINYTNEEIFVCYIRRNDIKILSSQGNDDENDDSNYHRTENNVSRAESNENVMTVKDQKEEGEESKLVIGGYAKWCFSTGQKAELSSLYIDPQYWNLGCGSMLWDHIMSRCQEESISCLDIWLLEKARSKYFYISKGCNQSKEEDGREGGKSGDYFVGHHKETALCYEMKFT